MLNRCLAYTLGLSTLWAAVCPLLTACGRTEWSQGVDESGELRSSGSDGPSVLTPIGASWSLVFDDEFNGSSLDIGQWRIVTNTPGPGVFANNRLATSAVAVSNGFLQLTVTPSGTTPPYDAGFITTGGSTGNFHSSQGYYEARMKMPDALGGAAHGIVSAFWGNGWYTGGPNSDPPELDILEWHGSTPDLAREAIRSIPDSTGKGYTPQPNQYPNAPGSPDLSADFHVYGCLWTATQVKWYIDGVLVGTVTDGELDSHGATAVVQSNPIALILNNTCDMNGEHPDASTRFPSTLLIDYVHVYEESASPVTPQTNYGGPGDAIGSGDS